MKTQTREQSRAAPHCAAPLRQANKDEKDTLGAVSTASERAIAGKWLSWRDKATRRFSMLRSRWIATNWAALIAGEIRLAPHESLGARARALRPPRRATDWICQVLGEAPATTATSRTQLSTPRVGRVHCTARAEAPPPAKRAACRRTTLVKRAGPSRSRQLARDESGGPTPLWRSLQCSSLRTYRQLCERRHLRRAARRA